MCLDVRCNEWQMCHVSTCFLVGVGTGYLALLVKSCLKTGLTGSLKGLIAFSAFVLNTGAMNHRVQPCVGNNHRYRTNCCWYCCRCLSNWIVNMKLWKLATATCKIAQKHWPWLSPDHIKGQEKELSSRCESERTLGSRTRDESLTDQETAAKRGNNLPKKKRTIHIQIGHKMDTDTDGLSSQQASTYFSLCETKWKG
jgi:hypothetical protein